MELTQQIAGYTVHARLLVERRRHPNAGFDAGASQLVATYVGEAKDVNNRAYTALMDEVDRAPAKIIDHFLSHLIAMTWDLPGGDVPWRYLQGTLERSTRIIASLKAQQVLKQDALNCAGVVIVCALEETQGWSQLRATVADPKYNTSEQWSSWDGGFLPWLLKWRVRGQLPKYTLEQREVEGNLSRRIREVKEVFLPSFERRLGEGLTKQIWDHVLGSGRGTYFAGLMRLDETESLADMVLRRLLLRLQAGDLALNENPGQLFTLPDRSFFVHPRCLMNLCGEEAMCDADTLHGILLRCGRASAVARMTVSPTGGRAVKLAGFYVSNAELKRQVERPDLHGDFDQTTPWLKVEFPLFDGTISKITG